VSRDIRSKDELDRLLKTEKDVIALFYSSYCFFSQEFLPVFEEYAARASGANCRIDVAVVEDCGDAYAIEVTPTVLVFRDGKVVRRLNGELGEGLNEEQLADLVESVRGREKAAGRER
jgi:thioredoxin-like negative regulator of GroEL